MTMLTLSDYDREVYEKKLKNFLPEKFIDIHTHLNKKEMTPYGAHNGGSTWIDLVADELLTEDLLSMFKELFPSSDVLPLVFGDCLHLHEEVNEYVLNESKKYNIPALYRTDYNMEKDKLEEDIKKGGFLGIKPYLSNCPPYIPGNEIRIFDFLPKEHLELADKNGWIIMLHIPRDKRLKDTVNLHQIMEIEEKYPNAKLVLAHIGRAYSKQDIGDAFNILKNTKHLKFDFTANLCCDAIEACIGAMGTERLMFGSDLPIAIMRMYRIVDGQGIYYNVVPRGLYGNIEGEAHMRETDEKDVTLMIYEQLLAFKQVAHKLKLRDSEVENIMYLNAKKILSL